MAGPVFESDGYLVDSQGQRIARVVHDDDTELLPSGIELDSEQTDTRTTGITTTITTIATIEFVVTSRPVWVHGYLPWLEAGAGELSIGMYLLDGSNVQKAANSVGVPTSDVGTGNVWERIDPGAGSVTRKLACNRAAGSVAFAVNSGLATTKAILRAITA